MTRSGVLLKSSVLKQGRRRRVCHGAPLAEPCSVQCLLQREPGMLQLFDLYQITFTFLLLSSGAAIGLVTLSCVSVAITVSGADFLSAYERPVLGKTKKSHHVM